MTSSLYFIGALFILAIGWVGFTFNRFVRQRNLQQEAWGGLDVQLKRRHDLIPRLVECVKGYKDYEASALGKITVARANAHNVKDVSQTGKLESGVTQTLRTLLSVAEAYPDLKASRHFQDLSAALIDTEDQIQYARRYYNGTVRDYAIMAESFPSRLVAGLFGFRPSAYFAVESSIERQAPEVKL